MNTYKTNQIAGMIGIHPNTVRLYEACGFISPPERQSNGYRVFTDVHIEQFRLARAALKVEVLQNGLRRKAVEIIRASAACHFDRAKALADSYLDQIRGEVKNAEEAIAITRQLLSGSSVFDCHQPLSLTRKEAAAFLQVTVDTLRNWELNGLLTVKRRQNGYRVYVREDLQRLKIIRSLRCAGYSLASILRMLQALSYNPFADIRLAINTPDAKDDVITACDKLLTSLDEAEKNTLYVKSQIRKIEKLKSESLH